MNMETGRGFNEQCITFSQMNLITNSRQIWRTITAWSRAYLISRYLGVGTKEALFAKLYDEFSHYGEMMRLIFGAEFAENFTWLLNEYTIALRELVSAQQEGNREEVSRTLERMYRNAAERARLLAQVNPFWNEATWRGMFETYLNYTIEMANAFITGNYSGDVANYDKITALSVQMADYFAQGIYDIISHDPMCPEVLECLELSPEQMEELPIMLRCMTLEQIEAVFLLRMFLFDLVVWTRQYLISRYLGVGNEEIVLQRLFELVDEFGRMLAIVFGADAIEGHMPMFYRKIDLITLLITAQIEGNTEAVNEITRLLYANTEEIASFLASINNFWDEAELRNSLFRHLRDMIEESTSFLTGEYDRSIDIMSYLLRRSESAGNYLALGLYRFITNTENA